MTHPQQPTALVIVAQGSEEIEAVAPGDVLVRSGARVTYAGVGGTALRGSRGVPLAADIPIEQAAGPYDAVIVPGGSKGADNIAASHAADALIKQQAASGRLLAAICAAPAVVLAPMGLLAGKRATCYPGAESRFPTDATHSHDPVVVDGALITSRGPGTTIPFALEIAKALAGPEKADEVARAMLVT